MCKFISLPLLVLLFIYGNYKALKLYSALYLIILIPH